MPAYIRKFCNGYFYIVEGMPENHRNNMLLDMPYLTRRQAERNLMKNGYMHMKRERKRK